MSDWPGWFYGPNGEAAIFNSQDEVPADWFTTPQEAIAHSSKKEPAEIVKETIDPPTSVNDENSNMQKVHISGQMRIVPKPKRPYNRKAK